MHGVEYIPEDWLERAAWAARCGERLDVYSRPVQTERRLGAGRRSTDPATHLLRPDEPFESLQV